jgi:hypothetical protein
MSRQFQRPSNALPTAFQRLPTGWAPSPPIPPTGVGRPPALERRPQRRRGETRASSTSSHEARCVHSRPKPTARGRQKKVAGAPAASPLGFTVLGYYDLLGDAPRPTREIAAALKLSTSSGRRALEDLEAQGLARRTRGANAEGGEKQGGADLWTRSPEGVAFAAGLHGDDFIEESRSRIISLTGDRENIGIFTTPPSPASPSAALAPDCILRERDSAAQNGSAEGGPPADVVVAGARGGGVAFLLADDHALFTLEWRVPFDPRIDEAIRGSASASRRSTEASAIARALRPSGRRSTWSQRSRGDERRR